MTNRLEDELRDLFRSDAAAAPDAAPVVELTLRTTGTAARPRRAVVLAAAAAAVLVVVAGATALRLADGSGSEQSSGVEPGSTTAVSPPTSAGPRGPLWPQSQASCVEEYGPRTLAGRDFAFDGTVTAIGAGTTDRPGMGKLGYAGVTFDVHEWFAGGDDATTTVDIDHPGGDPSRDVGDELGPSYAVGTRLLVSGAHRWGLETDEDLIAWGCGFTRYYDERTAAVWREAIAP